MATKRIAKELGVTPAGLSFVARLLATGAAPVRGNEANRLWKDGFIAPRDSIGTNNYQSRPWEVTDAGRALVQRAREMGW